MTVRVHALSALVLVLGACTHELEGAPCECADGYTCCVAEDACRAGPEHCLADLACDGAHAPPCGPHSHCVDGPAGGECACDEGYGGTRCDQCTRGFNRTELGCAPSTLLPSCERDGGCGGCAEKLFCDTPASIAELMLMVGSVLS